MLFRSDLVAVPRSDGRSTLGVVVDKDAQGQLRVEMIDEATDRFALKTLSAGQLLAANPIKIGDYLEIDDKQIWVKGVGRDGRLEAYVKQPGKEQITVGGDAFASLVQQAQHQHAYATALERLPGMNVVPEVTQRLARYALDVGPSDKVFGRLSLALHAALERPAALGATPKEQADALTTLLRQDPAHLHAVLPNFRTERAPAHVAHDVASQGPGAHPLMRPMAGTAVPGFRELAVTFFHGVQQHTLRVVEPFPPPPPPAGKRHATMAEVIYNLAKLPYDALKEVKNVVVNPTSSPDDAFWQREFNDPNHAAYMSADKANRTLSLFPARDFSEMELSLAHEVGHFVGHAKLGNPPNTKGNGGDPRWTRWDAAQRTDNISVSRYAKNNLDEDFAETYSLYTMSKGTPAHAKYRGLMPNRFAVLDALTGATAPQQPRTS